MTRVSPNKRKSLAAGESSPKKPKTNPKTPTNTPKMTPKSAKKMGKMANGATPGVGKTPKSAKKNQKVTNGANTPKPEEVVPGSPESPEVTGSEEEMEVPQAITPKPTKKEKPVKSGEKMQKFGGMKQLEEKIGTETYNKLNRSQRRRMLRKLKKKELADDDKTVAQKTVAEMNEGPTQKNIKKKNKKTKSILNKSGEDAVKGTPAGKKSPNKKGKGKVAEIVS